MKFTIPGKPQPKQRPRFGKGRTYTSKETSTYEAVVAMSALMARPRGWDKSARYRVEILAVFGDRRRRDLDNVVKSILDGCNVTVWNDDSQVDEIEIKRGYDKAEPRAEILVSIIEKK